MVHYDFKRISNISQLTGAVEYTDCIAVEGKTPSQRVSFYDTKQSDGDIPVMVEL